MIGSNHVQFANRYRELFTDNYPEGDAEAFKAVTRLPRVLLSKHVTMLRTTRADEVSSFVAGKEGESSLLYAAVMYTQDAHRRTNAMLRKSIAHLSSDGEKQRINLHVVDYAKLLLAAIRVLPLHSVANPVYRGEKVLFEDDT